MMKVFACAVLLMAALPGLALAQTPPPAQAAAPSAEEAALIALSHQKWAWMAEKNVAALDTLFDEKAIFVHMSRTMTKPQELEIIRSGGIEYRRATVNDVSVRVIGDTAIVWSRIELEAIVGGNVANNPFTVTETFVKVGDEWKLGALVFSLFRGPPAAAAAQTPSQ